METVTSHPTENDIREKGVRMLVSQHKTLDTDSLPLEHKTTYRFFNPHLGVFKAQLEVDLLGIYTIWYGGYRCYFSNEDTKIIMSRPRRFSDGSLETDKFEVSMVRSQT